MAGPGMSVTERRSSALPFIGTRYSNGTMVLDL